MNPSELQPHELLQIIATFFESQGIQYLVVGSVASMRYGEPRFTNDVDILADVRLEQIASLCASFPAPEYYVSEQAACDAVDRKSQFNIIHLASGLKVDVIIPPGTEFSRSEMSRGRRLTSGGEFSATFASPEDVLLNKLRFYQIGESDKHLRDIAGMVKVLGDKLDRDYIETWCEKLGLKAEWKLFLERLSLNRCT